MLQFYLQLLDTAAEKEKFEKLYEQYRKLMMAEANAILKSKHLAEDAVQEAFLRIIKSFDYVEEILSPRTKRFVVIIARNVALTILSKEKRIMDMHEFVGLHSDSDEESEENISRMWGNLSSGVDETTDEVLAGELTEAVKSLPEWAADAIMLSAVYGCSVQETAVILGVSRETAKKRIQRARALLIRKLKEGGMYDE